MTPPDAFCERCGARLAGVEAVCPRCDRELSSPPVDLAAGKYRCPACNGRFDQPTPIWLPRGAPWYRPQRAGEQCPHCSALLRDRKSVHHSTGEIAGLWLIILAAGYSPWRPWTQVVLGVAYLLVELVRWKRARFAPMAEEDRFGLEGSGRSS